MQPKRMATRADYLAMFGMGKSEIVKRHAEKHGLEVLDIKIFDDEERDQRQGYDDATCGRDAKVDASISYRQGFLEGKLIKIDWAVQELKDIVAKWA